MRHPAVMIALLLPLAGCALSDDEQTAADSLAPAVAAQDVSAKESASCVAEAWVGEVGTGRLVEDGLLTADFRARPGNLRATLAGGHVVSEATAEGYAAAWYSCADFDVMSQDQKASFPAVTDQELDSFADCLKEIDDELWKKATVDRMTGDGASPAATDLADKRNACDAALAREAVS